MAPVDIDFDKLSLMHKEACEKKAMQIRNKTEKIEQHKRTLDQKCDELYHKYCDDENPRSINRSLEKQVKHSGNSDVVDLHMNFNIEDFKGWNKFVPFKDDGNGRNYNARPANCLGYFLQKMKDKKHLPENLDFDVWGNKKFTVKFTLHFSFYSEAGVQVAEVESTATTNV